MAQTRFVTLEPGVVVDIATAAGIGDGRYTLDNVGVYSVRVAFVDSLPANLQDDSITSFAPMIPPHGYGSSRGFSLNGDHMLVVSGEGSTVAITEDE